MQDRFKFRVFIPDKKNSKNSLTGMFKVHSLHTGTNKVIITSLYGNCSIKLENNILMQCTGLKDKNCKLIYEGDIVRIYNKIYEVIFEIRTAYFGLKISNVETATLNNIDTQTTEIEVIGNIYENPELLEAKND